MKRMLVLLAIFAPLLCSAKIVCEPGVNRFGDWTPCLKGHYEPGTTESSNLSDPQLDGKVERVRKNIDGSVTVWRHGSSDDEQWQQVDENTWKRTR